MLKNNYIDTSVQKGGIPGLSGCLEHTRVVTQILREARESRRDFAVLWLDFAKAYGFILHKLVEEALKRYHVPGKTRICILGYYDNFQMRISSRIITSDWHRLERGIITGCTLFATLFTLAINMIVKSAEMMKTGGCQPPIRAYMDDLTVTTTSVMRSRWIQRSLEKLIALAGMKFKSAKLRSSVVKKRKTADNFRFWLLGTTIPTLSECPVTNLGKIFNSKLRDTNAMRVTVGNLELWQAGGANQVSRTVSKRGYISTQYFPGLCGCNFVMYPQWQ